MYRERRLAELGGALFVVLAAVGVILYFGHDPAHGSSNRVITFKEEASLGDEAARLMIARYGGEDPDVEARLLVAEVGKDLVAHSSAGKSGFSFRFHDLADDRTVNAFALPGGHILITRGLLTRLESRGQLAGILAHQCAHVMARHWMRRDDKTALYGDRNAGLRIVALRLLDFKFSLTDELEADRSGVDLMSEAGYDPRSLIEVLEALNKPGVPTRDEFLTTHPNPPKREEGILREIALRFPHGLPHGLVR